MQNTMVRGGGEMAMADRKKTVNEELGKGLKKGKEKRRKNT